MPLVLLGRSAGGDAYQFQPGILLKFRSPLAMVSTAAGIETAGSHAMSRPPPGSQSSGPRYRHCALARPPHCGLAFHAAIHSVRRMKKYAAIQTSKAEQK